MAAKYFRGWLRLKGFVAAASGYWRRLGGLPARRVDEMGKDEDDKDALPKAGRSSWNG